MIQLACHYNSEIFLEDKYCRINAKSLMGVMTFRPARGMPLSIIATGNDELEAISAIENFLVHG